MIIQFFGGMGSDFYRVDINKALICKSSVITVFKMRMRQLTAGRSAFCRGTVAGFAFFASSSISYKPLTIVDV